MNNEQLIERIGGLSQEDFISFCFNMLKNTYGENLRNCYDIEGAFYTKSESGLVSPLKLASVFIVDYLPYELFKNPREIPFDNLLIRKRLISIKEEFDKSPAIFGCPCSSVSDNIIGGIFFFNHIIGPKREFFTEVALDKYEKMLIELGMNTKKVGLDISLGIGSPYSYIGNTPQSAISALKYIESYNEQLAIEFSDQGYEVNKIRQGRYVTSGIGRVAGDIFFPCLVKRKAYRICDEFERLLNSNPSEKILSDFIIENYRDILGYKYDVIESEVSLRFPDLDIAGKNRRVDILVHNCVENDWELIELKKKIKLSTIYRGQPVFSSEIMYAIQQLKNYYNILLQDRVREHFLREGIEYYNPSIKLIVGGQKNVSHKQWRQMLASTDDVHLITYDDLIKEMRTRYL